MLSDPLIFLSDPLIFLSDPLICEKNLPVTRVWHALTRTLDPKNYQKVDRPCNHPSYHVDTMLTPDAGKKCQLHPTSERLGKSAWEQQVFPPNIQLQSSGNFPNIKHQWISLLASNLISLPQVPECHPTHSGNLRRPPTNCYSQSLVGSTVPLRNYLPGITQGI